MSDDGVHCARCGDYAKEHPNDDWVCPECGVHNSPPEPPHPAPKANPARSSPAAVVSALLLLVTTLGLGPPVLGVVAKVMWRTFLFGWELIP